VTAGKSSGSGHGVLANGALLQFRPLSLGESYLGVVLVQILKEGSEFLVFIQLLHELVYVVEEAVADVDLGREEAERRTGMPEHEHLEEEVQELLGEAEGDIEVKLGGNLIVIGNEAEGLVNFEAEVDQMLN
jgi:hypothetical protein